MLLERKETTVAYRCPGCGAIVTSMVGAFALRADMMKLKCPCGGSEISIIYTRDKKVRLSVPCFTCRQNHTYTVSQQIFFSENAFRIPCSISGIDIFFSGSEKNVNAAVKEAEEELWEYYNAFAESEYSGGPDLGKMSDEQIKELVELVVNDIKTANEIRCRCPEGTGEYVSDVTENGINVMCKNCGASAFIRTDDREKAEEFLVSDSDSLELN